MNCASFRLGGSLLFLSMLTACGPEGGSRGALNVGDGSGQELAFDVRLTSEAASLSTTSGESVVGRAYVEFLGSQLRPVTMSFDANDLPPGVVTQILPTVLEESGYVVFSLLPMEGTPALTATLQLEARYDAVVRRAPVELVVKP
jgi:hypothetical protein